MNSIKLPLDKTKHFIAGMIISFVISIISGIWFLPLSSVLIGLTFSIITGILKELVWDQWMGRGTYDFYDAMSTSGGGVLGSAIAFGLLAYPVL